MKAVINTPNGAKITIEADTEEKLNAIKAKYEKQLGIKKSKSETLSKVQKTEKIG